MDAAIATQKKIVELKMPNDLVSYFDVLNDLEVTKPDNHLLLGNGFNLSLGVMTEYDAIFTVMKENNKEYETIIGDNFNLETFIGDCKEQIKKENNPYYEFMRCYFNNKIKLDFMKAVTQIVSNEIKNIYQTKNEDIYLLLKQFTNFFTLNYDPLLYQLMMSYKTKKKTDSVITFKNTFSFIEDTLDIQSKEIIDVIKKGYNSGILNITVGDQIKRLDLGLLKKTVFKNEIQLFFSGRYTSTQINKAVDRFWEEKDLDKPKVLDNINDGFSLFENELVYTNSEKQNLFFLHGAFHIYRKGKRVKKIIQQTEESLYKRIENIIQNENENIICIFTDKNKYTEISQDDYLINGYNKLKELSGSLLIIGSSLAKNDEHIFSQINKSNVNTIYISSSKNTKELDLKNALDYFPRKTIILFDWETISFGEKK